jgi:hypothetical protein
MVGAPWQGVDVATGVAAMPVDDTFRRVSVGLPTNARPLERGQMAINGGPGVTMKRPARIGAIIHEGNDAAGRQGSNQ